MFRRMFTASLKAKSGASRQAPPLPVRYAASFRLTGGVPPHHEARYRENRRYAPARHAREHETSRRALPEHERRLGEHFGEPHCCGRRARHTDRVRDALNSRPVCDTRAPRQRTFLLEGRRSDGRPSRGCIPSSTMDPRPGKFRYKNSPARSSRWVRSRTGNSCSSPRGRPAELHQSPHRC